MGFRVHAPGEGSEDLDLKEFAVWWDDITADDVEQLRTAIDLATKEYDVQAFLQARPELLVQALGGGHGRWVIPQKRLGAELVTDFVIGERHSGGYRWIAVELESPRRSMFTRSGELSAAATHAIRQITDWRAWLTANRDYAVRSRQEQGLGLRDIDDHVDGLVLIGRDRDYEQMTNPRRRAFERQSNISLHTFDWLLRSAEQRRHAIEKLHGSAKT